MQKQLHCFILWENGRYMEKEILAAIRKEFTIIKIYEVDWGSNFTRNLTRLYGKNILRSHKKEKESGCGKFLFIPVYDEHPVEENGKNSNISAMKYKLRQMTIDRGRFLVHSSDCVEEADMNMRFVLGVGTKEFMKNNKELLDNSHYIPVNGMLAQNGWKNKKQLLDFVKTMPNTKIISEKNLQFKTGDCYLLQRLLNAKKPLLCLQRNIYKVKIADKFQKIKISA